MMSNNFSSLNNSHFSVAKTVWRNVAVAVFAVCFALLGLGVTVLPTRAAVPVIVELNQMSHFNIENGELLGLSDAGKAIADTADAIRIILPDTVTAIADTTSATAPFKGYEDKLSRVTFPNGLTKIGRSAFYKCNQIVNIDLSRTQVKSIGGSAFSDCKKLTTIKLPSTLTNFTGTYIFSGDPVLTDIDLSTTQITELTAYAFNYCTNLTTVKLPNTLTTLGEGVFNVSGITELDLSVTQVETIGKGAFNECKNLSTVQFPITLQRISENAFYNTGLVDVDLSNTQVANIEDNTFYRCAKLTTVKLSQNCLSIGRSAFYENKNLKDFVVSPVLTTVGNYAFYNCNSLQNFDFANTQIITISDYSFYACDALSKIKLPSSLESLGAYAFSYSTELNEIDMSQVPMTVLSGSAFRDNQSLKKFICPDGLVELKGNLFDGCYGLSEVIFPTGLKLIGESVFSSCNALKNVDLSHTQVTNIGNYAFGNSALETIYLPAGVTEMSSYVFSSSLCAIICPDDEVCEVYKARYASLANKVTYPEDVLRINLINNGTTSTQIERTLAGPEFIAWYFENGRWVQNFEYQPAPLPKLPNGMYWQADDGEVITTKYLQTKFDEAVNKGLLTLNATAMLPDNSKILVAPTIGKNTFVYDGTEHIYLPAGFDNTKMTIDGNVQNEIGTHTVTVTANAGYLFNDNGTYTEKITLTFTIIKPTTDESSDDTDSVQAKNNNDMVMMIAVGCGVGGGAAVLAGGAVIVAVAVKRRKK